MINFCPNCGSSVMNDIEEKFYKDGRFMCLECKKIFRIKIDKIKTFEELEIESAVKCGIDLYDG